MEQGTAHDTTRRGIISLRRSVVDPSLLVSTEIYVRSRRYRLQGTSTGAELVDCCRVEMLRTGLGCVEASCIA
jgi:hypothetical protein